MARTLAAALWLAALSASAAQSGVEAWVQRYSHPEGDTYDSGYRVVTDSADNLIVVGVTDNGISGRDFLIIKYSGGGVPLWTNRYNGPANNPDLPEAVAVDRSGNVFVAGQTGVGGTTDFVTLAYTSAGVPMWTNQYNGPGNFVDHAIAVAVDGNGDVIVTGHSWAGGSYDYATIKYSGAGVPLWINSYNGPANGLDQPLAVAVDGNDTVFVTGISFVPGSSGDYATVAYSAAGVPLWTNRYNGPANGKDGATAMAVDNSGNVFVTGSSMGTDAYVHYATVAYSGTGLPLWTNRYSGPGNFTDQPSAAAVDGNGNVIVTGSSLGETSTNDYATVAYSGAGVPLWTNRYNASGITEDQARAVVVDSSGNVFVTGSSATIAYSATGETLWTNRSSGASIASDSSGNLFVTKDVWTGTSYDCFTVAYSGAGTPLWTNTYNGLGNGSDQPSAVAVDGNGNVFVTGSSFGNGSLSDYATVAYSTEGVPLWTNRYNGPGNQEDYAVALAVDGTGSAVVTGYSAATNLSPYNLDYATIKYSGAGMPLWTNRYNGPGNTNDQASAVAVDGSGNVFVTGNSRGTGTSTDYATIKYSGAGVPLWTNRYDGPGNDEDMARALALGGGGNVVVTGSSRSTDSFTSVDYATVAYSGSGVALWTNRYNGPGRDEDIARAVAVDRLGNVFVTGTSRSTNTFASADYATVAYSAAGAPLWTNRYNGSGNSHDVANAVAVDRSGKVFVTGSSTGPRAEYDYVTVAYSGAGVPLWTNRYIGPGNSDDFATAVAVDHGGIVIVTGYSIGNGSYDYATVAYTGGGVALWTNRYNGPVNGDDRPATSSCLAIGPDGAAYVSGASDGNSGSATTYDYVTIKYSGATPLPIHLNFQIVSNQLVLSWTNTAFKLQSAPFVQGQYTTILGATSPHRAPFAGVQRYFRLRAD